MEKRTRGYVVSLYLMHNDRLKKISGTACFSTLYSMIDKNILKLEGNDIEISKNTHIYLKCPKGKFTDYVTNEQLHTLIHLINDITECELEIIKDEEYIKFGLLDSYDKSLFLLSFIRNIWFDSTNGYCELFFEEICNEKDKKYDSLEFLMSCNIKSCERYKEEISIHNYRDHNNFIKSDLLDKPRILKINDFMKMQNISKVEEILYNE